MGRVKMGMIVVAMAFYVWGGGFTELFSQGSGGMVYAQESPEPETPDDTHEHQDGKGHEEHGEGKGTGHYMEHDEGKDRGQPPGIAEAPTPVMFMGGIVLILLVVLGVIWMKRRKGKVT